MNYHCQIIKPEWTITTIDILHYQNYLRVGWGQQGQYMYHLFFTSVIYMYTNFAQVMFTYMYITHFAQVMFTCTSPILHKWCLHVHTHFAQVMFTCITHAQVMFTCITHYAKWCLHVHHSLCTSDIYMYIIMHKWSLHVHHSFCTSYVYMYITHFAQEMFTFFFFPFFHISAFFYKLRINYFGGAN